MTYTYTNAITGGIWDYDGPLPIDPADAVEALADGATHVRFSLTTTIDDMISCIGTEGWEEYMDAEVGFPVGYPDIEIDHPATAALGDRERRYTLVLTATCSMDPDDIDTRAQTSPVRVRFFPEAWQNDYAVPVDPEGETVWFVSERTADRIRDLPERGDLDFVQFDAFAPQWVREWAGPFTIRLHESA